MVLGRRVSQAAAASAARSVRIGASPAAHFRSLSCSSRAASPWSSSKSLASRSLLPSSLAARPLGAAPWQCAASARSFSLWPTSQPKAPEQAARDLLTDQAERGASVAPGVAAEAAPSTGTEGVTVSGESVSERVGEAISAVDASAVSDVLGMSGSTAMHVGDLKALGLASNWTPVGWIQQALEAITATTGLPWWATIVGATITLRLCIAPLMVHVQGNSIRLANIQPQMQALMGDIQHAKASGDAMEMQKAALKVRKLLSDNDCSPFRSLLLPAVQMPIFVSFFFALRNIAEAGIPSMKIGGFSWITDLTAADPYYVLPILSAGMTLLVLETGAETGTQAATSQTKMIRNVARVLTVVFIPFICQFPSAVLLYWATNNTFSLLQLLLLRTSFMKKALNLPEKVAPPAPKPGDKAPMGFMESFRSGVASQTSAPPAPSRQMNDIGRESAMRDLLEGTDKQAAGESAQKRTEGGQQSEATAGGDDKKRRVQAARERRAGRKRY